MVEPGSEPWHLVPFPGGSRETEAPFPLPTASSPPGPRDLGLDLLVPQFLYLEDRGILGLPPRVALVNKKILGLVGRGKGAPAWVPTVEARGL